MPYKYQQLKYTYQYFCSPPFSDKGFDSEELDDSSCYFPGTTPYNCCTFVYTYVL